MIETDKAKEEKKVISIYQIDTSLKELKNNDKNAWESIQAIVKKSKYNPEERILKNNFLRNYDTKCYKLSSNSLVGWKKFAEEFLEEPLNITNSKSFGILLLIKPKDTFDTIYAIAFGNLSYFVIQNYIDTNFGLDILSRIIAPNSNIVKSSKGQNVVGSTQGQLSIYRQLHSLSDIEDFGRIFQELNANIKKEALGKFGINTEKDFKNCCAKASFQIKTSISSSIIEKYIDGCQYAKTQPAQPINASKQLDKKKDKDLIDKIITSKVQQLWKEIEAGEHIGLCHKNFDKYINANYYECKYKKKKIELSIEDSLYYVTKRFDVSDDKFNKFLKTAEIISYDEDGKLITQDKIINHLFLEFTEEDTDQKYFILNGVVYKLQESFIESLNNKINKYKNKDLFLLNPSLKQWEYKKTESEFNEIFEHDDCTIVIHPYKHINIELCDIIKYDAQNVYLYFVKDGFEKNIRDLSYQVYNTAKIIETDINSGFKFLHTFYDKFKTIHPNKIKLSKTAFIDLFRVKDIKFIFAFRDKNNRKLQDNPEKFSSNIAKFALIDLVQKMNLIDNSSLKVEQIESI